MAIAPTIGSAIIDKTSDKDYGYFWVSFFWLCAVGVGLIFNILLYFEDIRKNGRVLDKVHVGVND
jgi:formate-dependent nitrite reductase membrane component NrfD